jgi:ATP-dependent exoDNAse (exonuclease V) beta subunit
LIITKLCGGADADETVGDHRLGDDDLKRLTSFYRGLTAHRQAAARLEPSVLLERITVETGYDSAVLAMEAFERRLANIRKLQRIANEYELQHGSDLRGFIDYVDELGRGEQMADVLESQAPIEGEELDAIRLMTIHRAKGLEFPVVCVADLGRRLPPGRRELLLLGEDDGRVGLRLLTLASERVSAFAYDELATQEDEKAAQEERRLFYVAATRAQERLILSGGIDLEKPANCPLAWLGEAFAPSVFTQLSPNQTEYLSERHYQGGKVRVRCVLHTSTQPATQSADQDIPLPIDATLEPSSAEIAISSSHPDLHVQPKLNVSLPNTSFSYSSLDSYRRCAYRYYLEHVLGLSRQEVTKPALQRDNGRLTPTKRGIVLHRLLEQLSFKRVVVPARSIVARAASECDVTLDDTTTRDIQAVIQGFVDSSLCERLVRARNVRQEVNFTFEVDTDFNPQIITGVIDVVADEPDRLLIVDYKSDRIDNISPDDLAARYILQRSVYALAGFHAGASTVEVAYCFLESPNTPVLTVYNKEVVPSLRTEISSLIEKINQGEFAPASNPHRELCLTCPGRETLCSWPQKMTLRTLTANLPDGDELDVTGQLEHSSS